MKNFILKRAGVLHLLALLSIAGSVFLKDVNTKAGLLFLGILGLILIANAKGQKILVLIYSALIIVAAIGVYLVYSGRFELP